MLESLGYDETTAAAFAPWAATDAVVGRVTSIEPGLITLVAREGLLRASAAGSLITEIAAHPVSAPCPGDWCVVRRWPDRRLTVERVLARRGVILTTAAPASTGPARPLVANVDLVALVMGRPAAEPAASPSDLVAAVRRTADGIPLVLVNEAAALHGGPTGSTIALVGDPRVTSALADRLLGARSIGARRSPVELRVRPAGGAVFDLGLLPVTGGAGGRSDTAAGRRP